MAHAALPGTRPLAFWMVLLLLASAVMTVQAFRAAGSHRRVAREAVANYANLAAALLVERLEVRFGAYTCATLAGFAAVLEAEAKAPRVDPADWVGRVAPRVHGALVGVREIRRLSLASDGPAGVPDPSPDSIGFAPATDPAYVGLRAALVERIANRTAADPDWGAVLRWRGACAYRVFADRNGAATHAWVFLFDPDRLTAALEEHATVLPLLPEFLHHGGAHPEWLHWRIESVDGLPLAASKAAVRFDGEYAGQAEGSAVLDRLVVRAQIDASAAGTLVSGGVPPSAVPQTLALLALNLALLAGAWVQTRREAAATLMREDFLASVSHDLRTPLAHIRLYAETMRLGRVRSEAERTRALEVIERESMRLTHLVDNVLLASRAGRKALTAERRREDVGALAREVARTFEPLAAARGVAVRCEIAEHLAADVDADLIRQALRNVLDNAVKYGPAGQTVTVSASTGGGLVSLRVDDSGPGIPAADRERVLERFFRLERDRGTAAAGSGLGLAVVRDIAILHGGSVTVGDSPSGGARVVLSLPAAGDRSA